mmetsp:Transcript_110190/g.355339  ORF Transcript_110190/g.355339 Transcript_110190/m.355339 type:complete len:224 (+) Transcript_110190:1114-1785(+)
MGVPVLFAALLPMETAHSRQQYLAHRGRPRLLDPHKCHFVAMALPFHMQVRGPECGILIAKPYLLSCARSHARISCTVANIETHEGVVVIVRCRTWAARLCLTRAHRLPQVASVVALCEQSAVQLRCCCCGLCCDFCGCARCGLCRELGLLGLLDVVRHKIHSGWSKTRTQKPCETRCNYQEGTHNLQFVCMFANFSEFLTTSHHLYTCMPTESPETYLRKTA